MYKVIGSNQFAVQHNYNTRNRNAAVASFHRLISTQRAITYIGPTLWNRIPDEIKAENTLPRFKRALKEYFLSTYV